VAQSTASGLHYVIEEPGTGGHPTLDDEVTVNYKGYLLDGNVFDQTSGTPITFGLRQVILGWQEGIPLFQKGGKGKLFIPSGLGYGANPPSGIPSRAVLAFDVDLVDF
jgi:FKBP-type peptidyl-prolyl cis-trans isomerase FkpA